RIQGKYLYLFVLGLTILSFIAPFFIKVPIVVHSHGVLSVAPNDNETVAEPSTDPLLLALVYVEPTDIDLIKKGMEVEIHFEAYDNQLSGTVQDIVSHIPCEVGTDTGLPFFVVRCSLTSQNPQLPNGYTGTLKEGMALEAQFRLGERPLSQWIFGKSTAG